ncbi:MAG: hypothetical protein PHG32_04455 [Candidatus Cloacimonetes bacterium]|nr:hypothetical protein [Candidatus Cloacimonadota bacterium]HOY84979.1 hypothetical protein [Candidatus Syntrophosphaera sp.]HPH61252.1 hypothetical protein [Candidatus Syntrophosphaera sp.]
MLLPKGDYRVWDDFALTLTADLGFRPGIHYLSGTNGSGKSSLLTRLLLPRLLNTNSVYSVYFEQQMQLQVTAVKAYASVVQPRRKINSEADTVDFLLDDLLQAWQSEPRPCYVVMDESLFAERVLDFLQANLLAFSLIYSAHTALFSADQTILFQPLSPTRSEVYVHHP